MTLATLRDVLQPALLGGYAVPGLVCLGWEDMRAYVAAAEAERAPVILQAGPGCRAHTPLPVLAVMFRHLAESASVPVVVHLDHGASLEECRAALDLGFYLSMSGIAAFPKSQDLRDIFATAPLDRILVETDAPYLAPPPYRGKRNEPAYTAHTARRAAETFGLSEAEFFARTTANFDRLFRKAKDWRHAA